MWQFFEYMCAKKKSPRVSAKNKSARTRTLQCAHPMTPASFQLASVDIGFRHFAWSFHTVCATQLHPISLDYFECVDLVHNGPQDARAIVEALLAHMSLSRERLTTVRVIVIEQQMATNTKAVAIQFALFAHCRTAFPSALVEFVPSRFKTQFFEFVPKKGSREHKRWSVEQVLQTLDAEQAVVFGALPKQDDVADTIMQARSYLTALRIKPKSALTKRFKAHV